MALTGLVAANNLGDVVDIEKTWDNIGNSISATVFVPAATLDLNFAGNKSLVDNVSGSGLVTFTRPSTGTFVGSNGLIQTAGSGVPRFDHNPVTGESLGLLVEEARTNYSLTSNTFSSWSQRTAGATSIVQNAGISPDGTNNAVKLILNNGYTSGYPIGLNNTAVGLPGSGSAATVSVYVKAAEYTNFCINFTRDNDVRVQYNLTNGTWFVEAGSLDSGESASIVNAGNGWWRASCTRLGNIAAWWIQPGGESAGTTVVGNGSSGILIWGAQSEAGAFPTSYIPTSGATVTRAADTASITGSNFSSWYNNTEGTVLFDAALGESADATPSIIFGNYLWATAPNVWRGRGNEPIIYPTNSSRTTRRKHAFGLKSNNHAVSINGGTVLAASLNNSISPSSSGPVSFNNSGNTLNGTIARLTYYPIRLSNITLQALTTNGPVSSFPYSFSIKGRDILALKEVNKTSTRDFIFTKGLLSKAQPRLTTASQYTSSGVALRDAAMPKFAPVTTGNYLFSSGLTLSGATVQINGTNALSIATSPFTGSGATVPLLFAGLRPQANWRISETMVSGVVASPESAIPIETSDFLLFMKAGQS